MHHWLGVEVAIVPEPPESTVPPCQWPLSPEYKTNQVDTSIRERLEAIDNFHVAVIDGQHYQIKVAIPATVTWKLFPDDSHALQITIKIDGGVALRELVVTPKEVTSGFVEYIGTFVVRNYLQKLVASSLRFAQMPIGREEQEAVEFTKLGQVEVTLHRGMIKDEPLDETQWLDMYSDVVVGPIRPSGHSEVVQRYPRADRLYTEPMVINQGGDSLRELKHGKTFVGTEDPQTIIFQYKNIQQIRAKDLVRVHPSSHVAKSDNRPLTFQEKTQLVVFAVLAQANPVFQDVAKRWSSRHNCQEIGKCVNFGPQWLEQQISGTNYTKADLIEDFYSMTVWAQSHPQKLKEVLAAIDHLKKSCFSKLESLSGCGKDRPDLHNEEHKIMFEERLGKRRNSGRSTSLSARSKRLATSSFELPSPGVQDHSSSSRTTSAESRLASKASDGLELPSVTFERETYPQSAEQAGRNPSIPQNAQLDQEITIEKSINTNAEVQGMVPEVELQSMTTKEINLSIENRAIKMQVMYSKNINDIRIAQLGLEKVQFEGEKARRENDNQAGEHEVSEHVLSLRIQELQWKVNLERYRAFQAGINEGDSQGVLELRLQWLRAKMEFETRRRQKLNRTEKSTEEWETQVAILETELLIERRKSNALSNRDV